MDLDQVWPLFGLRLMTPRLELRPLRDEDLPGLVDSAVSGVHDPARMPFGVPWTDAEPTTLARSLAQYHWKLRSGVGRDSWGVSFTVLHEGTPVGVQELHARRFATRKTVESGSWLTLAHQGHGLGTEMRAALLLFSFDHLRAEWAESSAAAWNEPSLRVSAKLGYEVNGVTRAQTRADEVVDEVRVRLRREDFARPSWSLVTEGVEAATEFLM
ncbi:GNAT family N-acetyltransferase [Curtobacterium flaccumfaciens]|uniref:GNAT family N-acetyltransferase n=1 Tax=Curtobacterium flaccumfaciens TaxID=2035 RepID=UPI001BDF187C|nr:GNAT family protein [Curtobacterium flaccumfaciens]MBT1596632.1 GNAT family N-acetyltransferase [Curtobacterium flaccumfaciens pv. flaccumfaciens]